MAAADYRFARSPRWIATHVLVLGVVVGMVALGLWQLRRLDERRDRNDLIEARVTLPAEPVAALVDGEPDVDELRFRAASASGAVEAVRTVRTTQDGAPGYHVLRAVRVDGDRGVVVLAGFLAGEANPPSATDDAVAVDGFAVPIGRTSRPVRREAERLAADTGLDLLPVLVQATTADPPLTPVPRPEGGDGPHLSYAVQWFLFGTVVVVGYPFLLRRRARDHP